MNNYDYPIGADNGSAPWNQEFIPDKEVEVVVSITMSKSFKIKVADYKIDSGKDEDGNIYEHIDYSECDLKSAVEDQIVLPNEAYQHVLNTVSDKVERDLEGYTTDDFEVILEN